MNSKEAKLNPRVGDFFECDPYGGHNQFDLVVLAVSPEMIRAKSPRAGEMHFPIEDWNRYVTQKKIYRTEP